MKKKAHLHNDFPNASVPLPIHKTGWKSATPSFPKLHLFKNKGYTQDQVQQWNQPCKQDGKTSYSHIWRVIKGMWHMESVFQLGHSFALTLSFSLLTYEENTFRSRTWRWWRWKRKPMTVESEALSGQDVCTQERCVKQKYATCIEDKLDKCVMCLDWRANK